MLASKDQLSDDKNNDKYLFFKTRLLDLVQWPSAAKIYTVIVVL